MSTHCPPSAFDWFHRRRKAASKDPHQAFRVRLRHMLIGDLSQRTPPLPTLPGQPANGDVAPEPSPTSSWRQPTRWDYPAPSTRKPVGKANKPAANDGDPPYSSQQLKEMDSRFVKRVERAFATGAESMAAASASRHEKAAR